MHRLRRRKHLAEPPALSGVNQLGKALGCVSLCLWVIIATIFWSGSDTMAFMTSLPLWACCLMFAFPALIAWLVFGSRIGLLGVIVWVAYGIMTTDFLQPISRTGMEYYKMPPSPDNRHIRILTLYGACGENPPIEQISKLRADVIFLQGCSNHNRTLKFAYSIFGRTAHIKQIGSCAIIVRHGQMGPVHSITDTAGLIVDWIPESSSLAIRLINLSLDPFEHRFDLYSPACWKYFHTLRFVHRKQIQYLFDTLREVGVQGGELPIILAGNFNAAPQSPIFVKIQQGLSGLLQTQRGRIRRHAARGFSPAPSGPRLLHASTPSGTGLHRPCSGHVQTFHSGGYIHAVISAPCFGKGEKIPIIPSRRGKWPETVVSCG